MIKKIYPPFPTHIVAKTFLIRISHFLSIALGLCVGKSTAKSKKTGNRRIDEIVEAELLD
jgi:hypothetical protein